MRRDVLAGAGDGHTVEQLEELEVESVHDCGRRPFRRGQILPIVEGTLRPPERLFDALTATELVRQATRVAPTGERELVLQVQEAVVHRGCRQHQHLGLDTCPDHLVHQCAVARVGLTLCGGRVVVAKVVALVDDDEIVVAPVDLIERHSHRFAALAQEVGVREHVVAKSVLVQDVRRQVAVVGLPVLGQLLGAEHEHGLVPELVVLDHCERRERLAESHAVREDAAVVGLQLVDQPNRCVLLELVERVPCLAVPVARPVVRQNVLVDVVEEGPKDHRQHQVVDSARGVLRVDFLDLLTQGVGDVAQPGVVLPELSETLGVLAGDVTVDLVDQGEAIGSLVSQVGGSEPGQRCVRHGLAISLDRQQRRDAAARVGLEAGRPPDPVRTVLRRCARRHSVAESDLERCAGDVPVAHDRRDDELAMGTGGAAIRDEGGTSEDELEPLEHAQMLAQRLEGVNRKGGGRAGNAISGVQLLLQVIAE